MGLDFALVLVVVTALSGGIWALDAAVFSRRRQSQAAAAEPVREPVLVEYARSFFPILLAVLFIRSFLVEPFRIPSGSMVPTLLVGDFIFVNKFSYGLRLPVLNTKIVDLGEPSRGDVVVFRLPSDPSINYIKRLVGLPGDHIRYVNKRLFINGVEVEFETLGPYDGPGQPGAILGHEKLGNVDHPLLLMPGRRSVEGSFVVPEGHYFMMGDNRDNSKDSRYRGVGFIPEDRLVGRAMRIWMNWEFPKAPRWERIGKAIR